MNILFVSLAVPIPATNGHRMRNRGLLAALAAENHHVTLVAYATTEECAHPSPELYKMCSDVRLMAEPALPIGLRHYFERLAYLVSEQPYGAARLSSERMRQAVTDALSQGSVDAVICDDVYMRANLPERLSVPLWLNKHDITHEILNRFLQFERNPFKRAYARLEHNKIRRLEVEACSAADVVLACSERDKSLIQQLCPRTKVHVFPNVIDLRNYAPTAEDDGRRVLYVGAMDWFPNADAVTFFAKDIFPMVQRRCPGTRFVIAGRNPSRALVRTIGNCEGVEFTGQIPDVRPILAQAAVCVVPLRIGSGTRLKILEAAAMGKAVVSTTIGAEGLNLEHGGELLIADDPEQFAAAVCSALTDPGRRRQLGMAARRKVELQYSLPALVKAVNEALYGICGPAPSLVTSPAQGQCGKKDARL